mmetsp:Transcript_33661/g.95231  ORF Transcript_33661/g.95231 Transcript_33661/m.95231 type:complete len:208 (+) Transcript_33661:2003-2626(+)
MHGLHQLVPQLEDGQALALLLHAADVLLPIGGRLTQRLGLPLRLLKAAEAHATELSRKVALALLRHGVLPRAAQVLGHCLQLRALLLLSELAALLHEGALRHCRPLQAAVWVLHNLDRAHLDPGLAALALEEKRLLLVDVNLVLLLGLEVKVEQPGAGLLVKGGVLLHLEHPASDKLLGLPSLGARQALTASPGVHIAVLLRGLDSR